MLRAFVLVLAAVLLAPFVRAADDNPLLRAKVGDWAKYSVTVPEQGEIMEQTHKVIRKTEKGITLETSLKPGNLPAKDRESLPQEVTQGQTTVVTIPFNQASDVSALGKGNVQVKELARGQETLVIAGEKISTQWVESQATYTEQEKPVTATLKVWTSQDVPLGLVKQEISSPQGKTVIALKSFGSGGA